MDTLSIIKGNSNMVFASWALVIATMVLALITFFYMRHTRGLAEHTQRLANETKRMADIMAREFELRIAPFIIIDQLSPLGGRSSKHFQPVICNKGSLPVLIKRIVLEWWYKDTPAKSYRKEAKIDKALGKGESTKSGDYVIKLTKEDMEMDNYKESQNLEFIQLLALAQGKIYCIYADVDGKEQKTGDLLFLETL
jgi:hypothetical protein